MKHSEWLLVGAKVGELWPNQSWPPATMASAYDLFRDVAKAYALMAVDALCSEGRDFAPAPGVVLAKALQIVIASTPALPDPDLTRALTPEEAERARLMAAALTGDKARLVQATWMEFARHSRSCRACGEVATRCRRPGLQSNVFPTMLSELCRDGRPLFEEWRYAADDLRTLPEQGVQQEAAI